MVTVKIWDGENLGLEHPKKSSFFSFEFRFREKRSKIDALLRMGSFKNTPLIIAKLWKKKLKLFYKNIIKLMNFLRIELFSPKIPTFKIYLSKIVKIIFWQRFEFEHTSSSTRKNLWNCFEFQFKEFKRKWILNLIYIFCDKIWGTF